VKKIGLVLSGGGARGLAHVGVLKVLQTNNIPIDCITGTSVGAFVGGIYAATRSVAVLEKIALEINWRELTYLFLDPGFKGGLISGNKIVQLIEKYVGNVEFKDLKIPFTAVATDFETGKMVEINRGKVSQAIRASIAVPLFFQPVVINNKVLFDGGLVSPLPVDSVKKMGASIVIGVDLYGDYLMDFETGKLNTTNILQQSIKLLLHNLALQEGKNADIIITPSLKGIGWGNLLTSKGSQEGILIGVQAAEKILPKIKALISVKKINFVVRWFEKIKKRLADLFH